MKRKLLLFLTIIFFSVLFLGFVNKTYADHSCKSTDPKSPDSCTQSSTCCNDQGWGCTSIEELPGPGGHSASATCEYKANSCINGANPTSKVIGNGEKDCSNVTCCAGFTCVYHKGAGGSNGITPAYNACENATPNVCNTNTSPATEPENCKSGAAPGTEGGCCNPQEVCSGYSPTMGTKNTCHFVADMCTTLSDGTKIDPSSCSPNSVSGSNAEGACCSATAVCVTSGSPVTGTTTKCVDNGTVIPPTIPCAENNNGRIVLQSGPCTKVSTALGDINTDPAGLIRSLFGIILSVTGVIAILIIIISGYKLIISQGNPEQLQGAREQLTAAIVGLLFIIFSLVILQVIGVSILKIPGFN